MGIYSRWRARRQAKKGGYVSYDLDKGTATYVPKKGEAVQTSLPPKTASVYTKDYVGGGGSTTITEGIGYTGGGGTTSRTTTRTSPTGVITTSTEDLRQKQILSGGGGSSGLTAMQKFEAGKDFSAEIYNPNTGTFQRSAYGTGGGGTAIDRFPTLAEQIKIDEANKKGDFSSVLTGHSTRTYNELTNLKNKISSLSTNLQNKGQSLDIKLDRFESDWKGYIKDGMFIGSEREYEVYQNNLKNINQEINEYNKSTGILKGNINLFKKTGGSISDEGSLLMPKIKGVIGVARKVIDLARTEFKIPIFVGAGGSIEAGKFKDVGEKGLEEDDLTFGEKLIYTPLSKMPTTYGDLAVIGTAGYLAPITATIGTGAMLFSPLIKEGLVGGGKHVADFGENIQNIPDLNPVGSSKITGGIIELAGKGIQGASYLVPEKPIDVLAFALFEKALGSKAIPKFVKSVGLKGLSGYEIHGAITDKGLTETERYGKYLIGGLAGLGAIPEDITLARKFKGRFFKDFGKTRIGEFGIQETKLDLGKTDFKIKSPREAQMEKTFDPVTLEFIPSRSETFTGRIDTLKVLSDKVNFKENPTIPKTTEIQTKILDIVKERGDVISGSFAQQTLIKGSRNFRDLDILSKNPQLLAEAIKKRLGDDVVIKKKTITDSPLGKFDIYKVYDKQGKHIADLDPIKFGEEGFASFFKPVKVKGYNLLPPEIRLVSKTLQQARPLFKGKRAKVVKDISQLKGEPILEVSPALLRGYGLTKAEQIRLAEGKELFFTHAGLGIKGKKGKIDLTKDLWATQSIKKEGILFARKSRMGFKDIEYASLKDFLKASERKKISLFPKQRDVLIGEAGTMRRGRTKEGWEIPEIKSTEIEIKKTIKEGRPQELKVIKEMHTILEGEPVRIRYVKEVEKTKAQRRMDERLERESRKSKTNKDESDLNKFLKDQEKTKGARGRRQEELILRVPQRPIFKVPVRTTPKSTLRQPVREIREIPRDLLRENPRTPERDIIRTPEREIPRNLLRDFPLRPVRRITRRPPKTPKKPPVISFPKKRMIKQPVGKTNSFDVYVKSKGKFRKITKKPLGLVDARNVRDFGIDNSLSRQGYLRPRQAKPSPLMYDISPTYSKDNAYKMRKFKQKKGKRTPLQRERVIEYSKYALDKKSEVKKINIFKALSQRRKKQNDFSNPFLYQKKKKNSKKKKLNNSWELP